MFGLGGMTEEELDRFVDLCCRYDNGPISYSWFTFNDRDHGLAALGLISVESYYAPVTVSLTEYGKAVFRDLDPVALIGSCIRLNDFGIAAYLVWAQLPAELLPEYLTHESKEICNAASERLRILIDA